MTEKLKRFVCGATMLLARPMPSRRRSSIRRADRLAIANDWQVVGRDLQTALDDYGRDFDVQKRTKAN